MKVGQSLVYTPINLKPIFHCKLGSRWVTYANEMSTNNMKDTWPTRKFCVGDPTQPTLYWLSLGFCVGGNATFMFCAGGNANCSIFKYQHVGIPNRKLWGWGSKPMRGPNANGFASQWNMGLTPHCADYRPLSYVVGN